VTEQGCSHAAARTLITGVYTNAAVLTKDAREATDTDGKPRTGDVLLNWETGAILARRTGEWTTPYKVFSPNVRTERPTAVVDRTVDKKGSRKVAEAFAMFLYTPAAQQAFADNGLLPVNAYARGRVPQVTCFHIGDLGGRPSFDRTRVGKRDVWDQIFSQTR
jgi:sulfate transport system substrate-binding protein